MASSSFSAVPVNHQPLSHSFSHSMSQPNGHHSFGDANGYRAAEPSSQAQIYTAVYSGVSVYEMEVHSVAVMKRRNDSFLNATQILKVAGVDKGKRTKILEKEILTGPHEKIQGGYGKYQGTWINYERGREFCRQYGVEELLRPLLDYDMGGDGTNAGSHIDTPTKEQAMAANRKRLYSSGLEKNYNNGQPVNGTFFQNISREASNALAAMHKAARFESPMPRPNSAPLRPGLARQSSQQMDGVNDAPPSASQQSATSFRSDGRRGSVGQQDSTYGTMSGQSYSKTPDINIADANEPPRKKYRQSSSQDMHATFDTTIMEETPTEPNESFVQNQFPRDREPMSLTPLPYPSDKASEETRMALLDLFGPDMARADLASHPALLHLSGQDLDLPLDQSSNTALHWAATLARVNLIKALVQKGANMYRGNAAGYTPLMSAVEVNNSYDHGCFPEMLEVLGPLIGFRDALGRTVLHHISVSSGIKGREKSSRYYLHSLLEFLVRKGAGGSNPSSQQASFDDTTSGRGRPMTLSRFMAEVVNVQDKSGNTALNLAARIGSRAIISELDELGADHSLPNHTGFRPTDFGAFPRAQSSSQQSSMPNNSSSQTKPPSQIEQIKEEIFATTTSILNQTYSQYTTELQKKQTLIDSQNSQLRDTAARHKAELDRFETYQRKSKARADVAQKISNLRRSIAEQRAKAANRKADASLTPEHENIDPDSTLPPSHQSPVTVDTLSSEQASFLSSLPPSQTLRALNAAHSNNNGRLEMQLASLRARSSELEDKYRRTVSLCTGVSEENVDGMLEGLVAAVESEGDASAAVVSPSVVANRAKTSLEIGRVREFLRKVEGVGA